MCCTVWNQLRRNLIASALQLQTKLGRELMQQGPSLPDDKALLTGVLSCLKRRSRGVGDRNVRQQTGCSQGLANLKSKFRYVTSKLTHIPYEPSKTRPSLPCQHFKFFIRHMCHFCYLTVRYWKRPICPQDEI
jgi:hypothetical protein